MAAALTPPAVEVADLHFRYGSRVALDGVSLRVEPGEYTVTARYSWDFHAKNGVRLVSNPVKLTVVAPAPAGLKEAQAITNLSKVTLWQATRNGHLRVWRYRGCVRIRPEDLRAFIEDHLTGAAA